jgi:hypothetical protein
MQAVDLERIPGHSLGMPTGIPSGRSGGAH